MANPETSPISTQNTEHYIWGDQCDGWHLVQNEQLSVIQERMPAGTTELRHFHSHSQQFFYVLSGEAVMEVDGKTVRLTPGTGTWIPAGTSHQLRNDSGADVNFLLVSQPPSHGDRQIVAGSNGS